VSRYNDTARHLWDKSPKRRGKRLALWANDGKTRKERARRWEAANDVARARARWVRRRSWRLWQLYHGIAKWTGRVAKRIRRRIRRDRTPKGGIKAVQIRSLAGGDPHWGGGGDVFQQFVIPFLRKRGLNPGSHKRTPAYNFQIGGSPTSDHLTTHLTTDAYDFGTYSGEDEARALALAFGITNWQPNSYATHYVKIDGHVFRIQILWGSAIGHGDHIHVGIGR
jgi:hypothetical protein